MLTLERVTVEVAEGLEAIAAKLRALVKQQSQHTAEQQPQQTSAGKRQIRHRRRRPESTRGQLRAFAAKIGPGGRFTLAEAQKVFPALPSPALRAQLSKLNDLGELRSPQRGHYEVVR